MARANASTLMCATSSTSPLAASVATLVTERQSEPAESDFHLELTFAGSFSVGLI
jgi:hypothetical protein